MSKNFEFLQQIEKEHEVVQEPVSPAVPGNRRKRRLDVEAFGQEERLKLVQRLFILPSSDAPRVVVFCCVESGDGSSWVCARACETLASQVKASVCAVDANLRTPSLHQQFQTGNHWGLADALCKPGPIRDFACQLNGSNLWLVTCGSETADPHTLLASERLPSRIAELKVEFDYVLLDGPPVNLYADATLLGRLGEGVVLVLGADSTRREAARKAKESLEAAKVRLLGAVLNKRTFPIPEAIYRWV